MENLELYPERYSVHRVLAHSYSVYFLAVLFGIILNMVFQFTVFSSYFWGMFGFFLIVVGSFLILWAQYTSFRLKKGDVVTKKTFLHGPYRFSRTPTNFGLFFLVLGFGMIVNSLSMIILSLIAFLIAKFIFLNKEENLLAKKYGAPYMEYKKQVKF